VRPLDQANVVFADQLRLHPEADAELEFSQVAHGAHTDENGSRKASR
jgi:hypothetical protein